MRPAGRVVGKVDNLLEVEWDDGTELEARVRGPWSDDTGNAQSVRTTYFRFEAAPGSDLEWTAGPFSISGPLRTVEAIWKSRPALDAWGGRTGDRP